MRACNRIQATKFEVPGGISHLLIRLLDASSRDGILGISALAIFHDITLSFCQTLSGHGKRIFTLCTCIINGCLLRVPSARARCARLTPFTDLYNAELHVSMRKASQPTRIRSSSLAHCIQPSKVLSYSASSSGSFVRTPRKFAMTMLGL